MVVAQMRTTLSHLVAGDRGVVPFMFCAPRRRVSPVEEDKPVKLASKLPAAVHRDLVAYAAALGRETGQPVSEPAKLIAPMLARFIAGDRAFAKMRSVRKPTQPPTEPAGARTSTEQG